MSIREGGTGGERRGNGFGGLKTRLSEVWHKCGISVALSDSQLLATLTSLPGSGRQGHGGCG